jgi:hypothetical protein
MFVLSVVLNAKVCLCLFICDFVEIIPLHASVIYSVMFDHSLIQFVARRHVVSILHVPLI